MRTVSHSINHPPKFSGVICKNTKPFPKDDRSIYKWTLDLQLTDDESGNDLTYARNAFDASDETKQRLYQIPVDSDALQPKGDRFQLYMTPENNAYVLKLHPPLDQMFKESPVNIDRIASNQVSGTIKYPWQKAFIKRLLEKAVLPPGYDESRTRFLATLEKSTPKLEPAEIIQAAREALRKKDTVPELARDVKDSLPPYIEKTRQYLATAQQQLNDLSALMNS